MNILILLYALFYFILAKLRLEWAVMLMLAALPAYLIRFKAFSLPFTLLELMILISFAVWFLFHTEFLNFVRGRYGFKNFKENRSKRKKYPFGIEICLLLIVSYVAVVVAGFSDSALGIWKAYFFEPVLVFVLILNVFREENKILWPLVISALAISLLAVWQKFTGVWIFNEFWAAAETRRVTSFFGYPNAVGLYLGPLILIMIGWLASRIKSSRRLLAEGLIGLTAILSILAIYFAKSRGALLGVLAGFIIFGLLVNKKARIATIVVLAILTIGIAVSQPIRHKAYDKVIYNKSWQIRQAQWAETWEMLKGGKIITGAGLANYKKSITPYHTEGIFYNDGTDPEFHRWTVWNAEYRARAWQPLEIYLYPHNIFLNFWTELGLAGLLLFIWIIGKYFYVGIKMQSAGQKTRDGPENRYLILGLVCAMVVIVIHGLVDVPYFKNDLAIMFWVFLAMMSLMNLRVKN